MKLTFDPRYNIAYIQLRKKEGQVNSIKVSEAVVIDIAPDGTIYGIELLNAKEQLQDSNSIHLQFINSATGEEQEIAVAA